MNRVRAKRGELMKFLTEKAAPYTGDNCLFWPYSNIQGYGIISIEGRNHRVHRLICEMVNGTPPTAKHEAAHLCGNGHLGCVTPRHLAWKTRAENAADMKIHGTVRDSRGENHGRAKLTDRDVVAIMRLKGAASQRKIASKFGVSQGTVHRIHAGDTWTHLFEKGAGHA